MFRAHFVKVVLWPRLPYYLVCAEGRMVGQNLAYREPATLLPVGVNQLSLVTALAHLFWDTCSALISFSLVPPHSWIRLWSLLMNR